MGTAVSSTAMTGVNAGMNAGMPVAAVSSGFGNWGGLAGAGANIVSGVGSLSTAYAQSEAIKTQGEYQKQQYSFNEKVANLQAADALKRGDKSASDHKKSTKKLIGAQRAALAAQGIEVDSGSALEIQQDTAALGAADAVQIKNNAWREAWGYRVQASDLGSRGSFAEIASKNEARQTILTGGMKAIGSGLGAVRDYYKG